MTKWLSQCGQYSSLSSNSSAFLRKHFLHFLQAKTISVLFWRSWSWVSAWHSAQSNHFLQQGLRMATWALRMCLLRRSGGGQRRRVGGAEQRGATNHMAAGV